MGDTKPAAAFLRQLADEMDSVPWRQRIDIPSVVAGTIRVIATHLEVVERDLALAVKERSQAWALHRDQGEHILRLEAEIRRLQRQ